MGPEIYPVLGQGSGERLLDSSSVLDIVQSTKEGKCSPRSSDGNSSGWWQLGAVSVANGTDLRSDIYAAGRGWPQQSPCIRIWSERRPNPHKPLGEMYPEAAKYTKFNEVGGLKVWFP